MIQKKFVIPKMRTGEIDLKETDKLYHHNERVHSL